MKNREPVTKKDLQQLIDVMESSTKIDYLIDITKEIKRLKAVRIELYGKDWPTLIWKAARTGMPGRPKGRKPKNISNDITNKYMYIIEEIKAINNISIGKTCKILGLKRNDYYNLNKGICPVRVENILKTINVNDYIKSDRYE